MTGPRWWHSFQNWWVIVWTIAIWVWAVAFPWWVSVFTAATGLVFILWLTNDD